MFSIKRIVLALVRGWDQWLHRERDLRMVGVLRMCYGVLFLVNIGVFGLDLEFFFGETGVLPWRMSRGIVDRDTWSLLQFLPRTDAALWTAWIVMAAHGVMLTIGLFPRTNAFFAFLWLMSFQHRHIILFDGEDIVFRLFCFFHIFAPADRYLSVHAWWRRKKGLPAKPLRGPAYNLQLMQLQMTLLYLSTAWEKARGTDWLDGTALYYVSRLHDLFGHYPVPNFFFEWMPLMKVMTWSVLCFELVLPFFLWFKETRRYIMVVALGFHVALEWSMNLFLFHWIMLVGLATFLTDDDLRDLAKLLRLPRLAPPEAAPVETEAEPVSA